MKKPSALRFSYQGHWSAPEMRKVALEPLSPLSLILKGRMGLVIVSRLPDDLHQCSADAVERILAPWVHSGEGF